MVPLRMTMKSLLLLSPSSLDSPSGPLYTTTNLIFGLDERVWTVECSQTLVTDRRRTVLTGFRRVRN